MEKSVSVVCTTDVSRAVNCRGCCGRGGGMGGGLRRHEDWLGEGSGACHTGEVDRSLLFEPQRRVGL